MTYSSGKNENTLKSFDRHDREAFRVFFKHYYTRLIKFALLYVPYQEHAEDVVSEVLIRLLKKRKEFFEMEKFEGYLFQAVKNQSISFLRKQKIHHVHKSVDLERDFLVCEHDPGKSLEFDELTQIIAKAVNGLPPRRQMIFKLVKEENQKIKEVAALLDIAPKTVENHLSMAVKELRATIKSYLSDRSSNTPIISMIKQVILLISLPFII